MKLLLQQIDLLYEEWRSLHPLIESYEKDLWYKLNLEWNFNSNHIEGNTLTYVETDMLLNKGKATGDHDVREIDEMRAHDLAVEWIKDMAREEEREISLADIRELNKIILVEPFWKEAQTPDGKKISKKIIPGAYKNSPNSVELPTGELFKYVEPEEVESKMQDLINWYREKSNEIHPLIIAATLHYRFVRIHPFDDGNGRVSRLLTNYHLLKKGYPPVIVKSPDKHNYLMALSKADSGDLEAFIQYIGKELIVALELGIKAAKGENIMEEEDWIKRLNVLVRGLEENPVQAKTSDIVYERYKDSFRPLFDRLKKLRTKFDPYFENVKVREDAYIQHKSDNLTSEELDARMLAYRDQDKLINLEKLQITIDWRGFMKDGTNTFMIFLNVEIDMLNEYKYTLKPSSNSRDQGIEKLYQTALTDAEITTCVNEMGNYLVNTIEQKIKSNKNT